MFKKKKLTEEELTRVSRLEIWVRDQAIEIRRLQQDVFNLRQIADENSISMSSLNKKVKMIEILLDESINMRLGLKKEEPTPQPVNMYGEQLFKTPALYAYCVKCKEKRGMVNMVRRVSDSGRVMMQGNCEVCNTKVNRIMGKEW